MNKAVILTAAAAIGLAGGLYVATSGGESPGGVGPGTDTGPDLSALEPLRQGDMAKLQLRTAPGSDTAFTAEDGGEMTLAAFEGKYTLVNFWATWCAPCREEMPQLAALQDAFGGDRFEVVTIATGRNAVPAMEAFFEEIGVTTLPLHRDPGQDLARDFGVLGLPVTVILDPSGQEIARLQGEADWAEPEARTLIATLIGAQT